MPIFAYLMNRPDYVAEERSRDSVEDRRVFSCFGIGEVADLNEEKGCNSGSSTF